MCFSLFDECVTVPILVSVRILLYVSQALIHGLNRHYYSIGINYRKNELEQKVTFAVSVSDFIAVASSYFA